MPDLQAGAIRRAPLLVLLLALIACTIERDRPRPSARALAIAEQAANPALSEPGAGGTLLFRLAHGRIELASRRFQ